MKSRTMFIAGNWKMNLLRESSVALASELAATIGSVTEVEVAVVPPFPYLLPVHEAIVGSRIALGAQDVYFEPPGAFTGAIATEMLTDCGCKYVIVGHSERRHKMHDDDEAVNRKLLRVLSANLKPILCVGERLPEREANQHFDIVGQQLRAALVGVPTEQFRRVTLAYEPVWAINTGKTASPEQAEEMHQFIRQSLTKMYGADLAQATCIQYGGSVTAEKAPGLLTQPNVDGALVGGASLKAAEFVGIVRAGVDAVR